MIELELTPEQALHLIDAIDYYQGHPGSREAARTPLDHVWLELKKIFGQFDGHVIFPDGHRLPDERDLP